MSSSRSDEWNLARWRRPNVAGPSLDYGEPRGDTGDEPAPLWKDLTVASGMALALWAVAALIFLG
jgi:hypothetical protein